MASTGYSKRPPQRPKWAQKLSAKEWKHLQAGQGTTRPSFRNLKMDAPMCSDCMRILCVLSNLGESE